MGSEGHRVLNNSTGSLRYITVYIVEFMKRRKPKDVYWQFLKPLHGQFSKVGSRITRVPCHSGDSNWDPNLQNYPYPKP